LHTYYATQSRAKIKKLKVQLRNPKKDCSISTYLLDQKKIVDTLAVVGAPISIVIKSKHHQLPFHDFETVYTCPFELVFADIWGSSPYHLSNGSRYYLVFLDAYLCFTWLYLISSKSQALSIFQRFKLFAEKQAGCILKSLQTDNAKEFLALTPYLHNNGIQHRLTCPHTHEKNGSIERKHRHVVETGLTLLSTAFIPYMFWGEAFLTATTIINHLPSSVLNNHNPYEVLFNKKLNYEFFKVFGCACYPLLRSYNHHKFEYHASICLFLGYDSKHKGYLCLLPSGKTIISRHVIFNETVFPSYK